MVSQCWVFLTHSMLITRRGVFILDHVNMPPQADGSRANHEPPSNENRVDDNPLVKMNPTDQLWRQSGQEVFCVVLFHECNDNQSQCAECNDNQSQCALS